jgi:prolipoprotein diacylglyceryl transferase
VWEVFGVPIRAYALCIIAGIAVATLVTERRLRQRGVAAWASLDVATWAVPAGIIGARLYHVITSPQAYLKDPVRALYVWEGGLGVWGAVAGGALGAWFAARRLGIPFGVLADAAAPGIPLAQAIGRLVNWFNNEVYGRATTLPWGLQIHEMDESGHATTTRSGLFHPVFLYEATWNLGVAALVWLLDRRYRFERGRAFALYVMAYTAGRVWIETLRTDEANTILGIRLNVFTSLVLFLLAATYFFATRKVLSQHRQP